MYTYRVISMYTSFLGEEERTSEGTHSDEEPREKVAPRQGERRSIRTVDGRKVSHKRIFISSVTRGYGITS